MPYDPLDAGLKRLGLTLSNVREEFIYIGGSKYSHANYFKLKYPAEQHPEHEAYCVCGHFIVENCYLRSTSSGQTLVVGNCCIKRYLPGACRTCNNCGVKHKNIVIDFCNGCRPKKGCGSLCGKCAAPHRNRSDNLCNDCRITPPAAVWD